MEEIQISLFIEFFLTVIVLIGGGVALYQIIAVTEKHTIHKIAIVIYGVFFIFMCIRLLSLIILENL